MEPFLKATTPDGRICISVLVPEGAEEAGSEPVLFKCAVTLDGKNRIEELETEDQEKMISWVRRQMKEAMRRNALPQGEEPWPGSQ